MELVRGHEEADGSSLLVPFESLDGDVGIGNGPGVYGVRELLVDPVGDVVDGVRGRGSTQEVGQDLDYQHLHLFYGLPSGRQGGVHLFQDLFSDESVAVVVIIVASCVSSGGL